MSFILGLRASARMLRLPSERGPYSMRPWNQPMILPSAIDRATNSSRAGSSMRVNGALRARSAASTSALSYSGPR